MIVQEKNRQEKPKNNARGRMEKSLTFLIGQRTQVIKAMEACLASDKELKLQADILMSLKGGTHPCHQKNDHNTRCKN